LKDQGYKITLGVSIVFLILASVMWFTTGIATAGPYLIIFFTGLAISFQGFKKLRGFSFSMIIFSAVTMAMYYPAYFVELDGYKLSNLIIPLIQLIMFGMGTSMSFGDFIGVVKTPKGVLIGLSAQVLIMPIIGFLLASVSGFSAEIAAGIILVGCSPSGLASNVMSYLAKANLALSITLTAVSTLLAPLFTPILMKLLAGEFIDIDVLKMMWDIVKMVIFPIGAGLVFNKLLKGKAIWLDVAMPLVSMFGIAMIIVIITAAGRDSLLEIGALLLVIVLVHNLSGYTIGYWYARLFKMNEKDCRTIALEVGMQNSGLASGIAKEMGKIATLGLASAVFGPLMNISGSILASVWQKKEIIDS
jgi:BASS family bile acid:Na+ symporter